MILTTIPRKVKPNGCVGDVMPSLEKSLSANLAFIGKSYDFFISATCWYKVLPV